MKKKVLLTNFSMINYTGSELDTLTIANYFLSKNYDVTIFTIEAGYPMLNEIDEKIKIIECIDNNRLENHYDLIWAHHYPLLDFLLFTKKIEADHIAYISLSSYEPYETIPPYYKYLDYVSILSKEGIDVLKEDGYDTKNINILGNYSFKKYFDAKKRNLNEEIKKICVISNHVPEEILECKKLFEKNNVQFDIYGNGYKYVKVDDELLKKYDIVITIAKTVYYGLSLGIPVYIYDHFGGDGYITKDNIEKSHYYNFSGRCSRKKYTGKELYNDISKNYKKALSSIEYNFNYAYNNFCFEKQMNKITNQISSLKKNDLNNIYNNYKVYMKTSGLFMREVIKIQLQKNNLDNNDIKTCKFYFDYGNGFSEDNSKIKYYKKQNNVFYVEINLDKKVKNLRFDIIDKPFIGIEYIKINNKEIELSETSNIEKIYNQKVTINDDPFVIIRNPQKNKLKFEVKFTLNFDNKLIDDYKEIILKFNETNEELHLVNKKLNITMNKIKLIQNSKTYKLSNKISLLWNKINIFKK